MSLAAASYRIADARETDEVVRTCPIGGPLGTGGGRPTMPAGGRVALVPSRTGAYRGGFFERTLMKVITLLCGALAILPCGALPVAAQTPSSGDDVRCLLLSVGYSRAAKDENSRKASAMTGAFYLGRVSGRMSGPALSAAIRAQGRGLPARQAEPAMRACAARAATAQQQLAAAASQAGIGQ